jgi:PhnB protein
MARLNPYLNFNGRCREAMTFYHQCLGGELTMQKVSESPMAAQLGSELGAHILHSTLTNDNIILMGSDMMGANLVNGNSITLLLQCSNDKEITHFFERLSINGQVKTPLHQSFWGGTYGELVDKYGLLWMLNVNRTEPELAL